MKKRIVICCDGTWNSPDKSKDGLPAATNVVKVAESIKPQGDDGLRQLMYYDPGVGSDGGWLTRMIDGATGRGLSSNLLEAYRYLMANYQVGDDLFLFGFSRGAFTVRSLVGMVRKCGILRPDAAAMVDTAFSFYKKGGLAAHPSEREASLFRRTYAVADWVPVKFMGVWDTVGALGNPLFPTGPIGRKFQFHDTDLSTSVQHACQALAVDEKRRAFKATLWHQRLNKEGQPVDPNQVLEQVWFVGVHSNVGGGYTKTGLSDIPLQWMVRRARLHGLTMTDIPPSLDARKQIEESRRWFFPVSKIFPRRRVIGEPDLSNWQGKPPSPRSRTNQRLDPSVLEWREEHPNYRPPNLEEYLRRNPRLPAPPETGG